MLPHVGLWAADCLARLRNGTGSGAGGRPGQRPPTCHDLGHLATFAAVSALRIGYPFELVLPMHRGLVSFPSVGAARLSRRDDSRWALVTQDRRGAAVRSARRTVRLPSRPSVRARVPDSAWRPVNWLTEEADGLRLQAMVETSDSLLGQLSLGAPPRGQALLSAWRSQVRAAWRLLVRCDRPVAAGIAATVNALIPLQQPAPGRLISATSGWAWGAIALSLAPDAATMAEALDHEFHHLVLAGAEDVTPLVRDGDGHLYYAPWRDDPRPAAALLQGSYAHFGVAGFWERVRRIQPGIAGPLRSEAEFARAHAASQEATRALIRSNVLTAAGRALADGMLAALAARRHPPVPAPASGVAAEIAAEHQIRWRLAHVRPAAAAVDAASRDYLAGEARAGPAGQPAADVVPGHFPAGPGLSALLEARYRDPAGLSRAIRHGQADAADLALLRGDYARAAEEYERRVVSGRDRAAWVGLLLADRRRTGDEGAAGREPELVVAVYDRICELTGQAPPIRPLIAWLGTAPADGAARR
jgi:HEXXH motif-containing protein